MRDLTVAIAIAAWLIMSGILYPKVLIVKEVSEADGLTLVSNEGCDYLYTGSGDDDYIVGDVVAAVMYNSGTADDARDDKVIKICRSGFCFEESEKTRADEIMDMRSIHGA